MNTLIRNIIMVMIVSAHWRGLAQDGLHTVNHLYNNYTHEYAWLNNKEQLRQLLSFLKDAPYVGLRTADYNVEFVDAVMTDKHVLRDERDSIETDVKITGLAILFFNDVAVGRNISGIGFNGLNYTADCINIPSLLTSALKDGSFSGFLKKVEPSFPEYVAVKNKLIEFTKSLLDSNFTQDELVSSRVVDTTNRPLIKRLVQLSIIDRNDKQTRFGELKQKVKQAQRMFSFLADGYISPTLLKELNIPLSVRVAELRYSLNTIRWLRCARMQYPHIVFVNIPSAFLFVYDHAGIALTTEVIVGKKTTRTPVFISRITEVILYPYWTVPAKMAAQELLPLIKRDISYLTDNNFQVLNREGRMVDPAKIEWGKLSPSNFPYTLRQSTGCDNSLGIVKLNFYSPYGVYLHDTPWKSLFYLNRRYFSHGCMRVNKAMELARLVLKDNTVVIDTLEEKGCLLNQKPIVVPASDRMPVFVLYNTAWVDATATVHFYADVYNRRSLSE